MNRDMELRSTKRTSRSWILVEFSKLKRIPWLLMKLLSYSLKFTRIHIIVLEESSKVYVLCMKNQMAFNWFDRVVSLYPIRSPGMYIHDPLEIAAVPVNVSLGIWIILGSRNYVLFLCSRYADRNISLWKETLSGQKLHLV